MKAYPLQRRGAFGHFEGSLGVLIYGTFCLGGIYNCRDWAGRASPREKKLLYGKRAVGNSALRRGRIATPKKRCSSPAELLGQVANAIVEFTANPNRIDPRASSRRILSGVSLLNCASPHFSGGRQRRWDSYGGSEMKNTIELRHRDRCMRRRSLNLGLIGFNY